MHQTVVFGLTLGAILVVNTFSFYKSTKALSEYFRKRRFFLRIWKNLKNPRPIS